MPVNRRAPEPLPQRGQHSWTRSTASGVPRLYQCVQRRFVAHCMAFVPGEDPDSEIPAPLAYAAIGSIPEGMCSA
jgi:hypothetical protein